MNKFEDMTYYEVLEVPQGATPSQIRQAYENILSVYQDDTLVSDSFFTGKEKQRIIDRIEKAYSTLSVERSRIVYNQIIGMAYGKTELFENPHDEEVKVVPIFEAPDKSLDKTGFLSRVSQLAETDHIKELIAEIHASDTVSGLSFRTLREALDISHEKIFDMTRIRISVLKSIEDNQFDQLPPNVYLKSFLRAFAEILQLDPDRAAKGFISYMEQGETL